MPSFAPSATPSYLSSACVVMANEVVPRTGFHEPFCRERNTTLAHPHADRRPGVSIWPGQFEWSVCMVAARMASRAHRSSSP